MKIETKFAIGEDVYIIFKEDDGIIKLFKDTIKEITLSSDSRITYYVDKICEEFNESEIIKYDDKEELVKIIDKLCIYDSNSK